ncbi:hypothetical protein [Cryobacterium tepidiphilum]|jgi:hypothetical protein|uniref:DUF4190 domain-containing protein n=1 Tax=Cryobacterium tepidiphilum TaxID=2486026 RepID=A0A3M8LQ68_9MICO|nr:hypothetical protein [Cryobacterium tepidiphilum]RNE66979.1 hypothetical protein EEJ31_01875 [Cryobacterium tepidiphilum]
MSVPRPARRLDALAVLSAVAGAAGLAAVFLRLPLVALVLAIGAIVIALVSRRRLRADDSLRGARLGVLGIVLGAIGGFLVVFPYLLAPILIAMGKLT